MRSSIRKLFECETDRDARVNPLERVAAGCAVLWLVAAVPAIGAIYQMLTALE